MHQTVSRQDVAHLLLVYRMHAVNFLCSGYQANNRLVLSMRQIAQRPTGRSSVVYLFAVNTIQFFLWKIKKSKSETSTHAISWPFNPFCHFHSTLTTYPGREDTNKAGSCFQLYCLLLLFAQITSNSASFAYVVSHRGLSIGIVI